MCSKPSIVKCELKHVSSGNDDAKMLNDYVYVRRLMYENAKMRDVYLLTWWGDVLDASPLKCVVMYVFF